jgi:hypothetical protein
LKTSVGGTVTIVCKDNYDYVASDERILVVQNICAKLD